MHHFPIPRWLPIALAITCIVLLVFYYRILISEDVEKFSKYEMQKMLDWYSKSGKCVYDRGTHNYVPKRDFRVFKYYYY